MRYQAEDAHRHVMVGGIMVDSKLILHHTFGATARYIAAFRDLSDD